MRVFISTGERSGEVYARLISKRIVETHPDAEIMGLEHTDGSQAPVGFAAGMAASGNVLSRIKTVERQVREQKPDVFLAVAWSEPNTVLGYRLRKMPGLRRIFFAPPQLWAWGRWRAGLLRRGYDQLLCLYPAEARFLRALNLPAFFRGNPLANQLMPYFTSRKEEGGSGTVALLPGSRPSEHSRNFQLLREFRIRWREKYPRDKAIWLFLTTEEAKVCSHLLDDGDLSVGGEQRYRFLSNTDLAIVTSGTASLETALVGTPQVVFYTMSRFEVTLARILTEVKYFSLPNLILEERVVHELLNPSADELFKAGLRVLDSEGKSEDIASRLHHILSVDTTPLFP